jgi:uncharacterized damage-inducible protein DinB
MDTFPIDGLRQLFRHMEWADAEVWRAVLAHEPAVGDPRLRELLTHLHLVQRVFLVVWQKQPFDLSRGQPQFATALDLRDWAQGYYGEATRFLAELDEVSLTGETVMPFVKAIEAQVGRTFATTTLRDTIVQVTSHSTYHRGQVNARLREVGGHPPLVDYIAWIWFGRPAPNWSAAAAAV